MDTWEEQIKSPNAPAMLSKLNSLSGFGEPGENAPGGGQGWGARDRHRPHTVRALEGGTRSGGPMNAADSTHGPVARDAPAATQIME